ncbi:MAG: MetQ/NlpA family ABC transporter substrate-binding protein [Pantoea sp.]|uniref:MetQ/NlpA family ABC transporter substrate-binding protein n=1 Tax=Pantoea phytobeneficialis TaxID=2052056 RepID=A0AAP9KN50_9GAMM|nr:MULTISPECIES: MetQ/NlpA family ABC transporter substrate-binding protein [Pantoea]ERK08086.1 Methionine ABC transporter substrate-binding protein [Pantoea sp. AS-PWVM4]MDO6409698.1 MetQ/NlpA family ABC transporter substrate-binding protein [Pantoea phytobeneficialis]QGR05414.1 metal ABC transporter substrate-binding protein [Pantoea phytobeneficialis]
MDKKVIAALALFSLASSYASAAALRVAADPVPHSEILNQIKQTDKKLDLQVIELNGNLNANELLARGDVDANYFQHVPYLRDQEKALGEKFAVVATVHIEPLGIYSHKIKSLKDVPQGAQVAVPNNVTNLSRALYLLQANGLIKLKSGSAGSLVTTADISDNPHQLKIIEIEAPQLPRALDDATLAIINGNYALQAGLVPSKDALGLEQAKDNPYANVLVTTPKLAHDPRILELAKDLESKQTAEFINQQYKGSVIPVHQ